MSFCIFSNFFPVRPKNVTVLVLKIHLTISLTVQTNKNFEKFHFRPKFLTSKFFFHQIAPPVRLFGESLKIVLRNIKAGLQLTEKVRIDNLG